MKNIKKRLDYKNHIYISAICLEDMKLQLTVICLYLHNKQTSFEYVFRVPSVEYQYENFHSRLIYNLPKRKLLELRKKEEKYER